MIEFVTHIGMSLLDRTCAVTTQQPLMTFPTVVGSGRRSWGRARTLNLLRSLATVQGKDPCRSPKTLGNLDNAQ